MFCMWLYCMWLLYGSEVRAHARRVEEQHDERRYRYGYYHGSCYGSCYGSCDTHPQNILLKPEEFPPSRTALFTGLLSAFDGRLGLHPTRLLSGL